LHSENVRFRSWVAPGLWIALIFTISSIPASPISKVYTQLTSVILRFLFSDPVGHVIMFGVLGFLLARSFRKNFPLMGKRNLILWAFLVSSLLALINEVYQQLIIPGRGFEIEDIIWDFVGIGVAIGCLSIASPSPLPSPPGERKK